MIKNIGKDWKKIKDDEKKKELRNKE